MNENEKEKEEFRPTKSACFLALAVTFYHSFIMAAEGDIIRFNYTDEDRRVPRNATHVTIAKSVRVVPEDAFYFNRNIVEVIFDVSVKKVEEGAFDSCTSLRRVIMPGVEIVEGGHSLIVEP